MFRLLLISSRDENKMAAEIDFFFPRQGRNGIGKGLYNASPQEATCLLCAVVPPCCFALQQRQF
jgi:hypothetical protein